MLKYNRNENLSNAIGGVLFLHFCSHCGHEIPHREKFCQSCGTRVEYLCAIQPLPSEPVKRREVHSAASMTKWIILYVVVILSTFGLSFLYFSSPDLFAWKKPSISHDTVASQPTVPVRSQPVRSETQTATLKSFYNQLTIWIQKAALLSEDLRKANIPGDQKRTAANYRSVQNGSDALIAQLTLPTEIAAEAGVTMMPLKECLSSLSKSASIMADYLDGKLSLAPPNPDWVGRSREHSAQSQARLKEAQQALSNLRKKIE